MIIGILSTIGPRYHPNRRLIEAASSMGHKATLVHPEHCVAEIYVDKLGLKFSNRATPFDVLLPRVGATIKDYTLTLLRHFELMGAPVVNGSQPILLARNKFLSLQAMTKHGIPVPNSYFVSNLNDILKVVPRLGGYPIVLKTVFSRQGNGVVRLDSPMTAEFILNNLPHTGHGLLVQEYLSPDKRKDIRALVLGDAVVAAMELSPNDGDFRTNIHLKGRGKIVSLNPELAKLAVRSSKALGLEISGVDIIIDAHGVPKVIEVNCAPGFRGLEATTGMDIASSMIGYITRTYGEHE